MLTPANALTALRLATAPAIAVAIAHDRRLLAGALFAVAVVTDLADGPLARRRGEASAFGGLFDHGVDALFVATVLGTLAWRGEVTWWLPALVVVAFLQYMLDSAALRGHPLRTSLLGRNNGVGYYIAGGIPVVRDALGLDWPGPRAVQLFALLLVVTTLASMLERAIVWVRTQDKRRP